MERATTWWGWLFKAELEPAEGKGVGERMLNSQVMRLVGFVVGLVLPVLAFAGIFDVKGKPASFAVVTVGEARPTGDGPTSPMLDQLQGVVGRLDKKQCLELRAAGAGPSVETAQALTRQYVVHLGDAGEGTSVEVLRDDAGLYYARELGAREGGKGKARVTKLNGAKFAKLAMEWARYRGSYSVPTGVKAGRVGELSRPYMAGWFYFDKEVMGERMLGGRLPTLGPTKRELPIATMKVRLPLKYDPRDACGLLVYVDPGPKAEVYQFMHPIADELGSIIVAVERIGNDVYLPDRWQLVLDSVATASAQYLIDPRRVYITGISGGGHVTTHMTLCFPDVFAGGVPIVALTSYEHVPTGTGQYYQGTFGKPKRELLALAKKRRLAAITGKLDGNHDSIIAVAKFFEKEGLDVRVSDYADMGHEAPTGERFAESLRWVDGPYRAMRETEEVQGELQLRRAMDEASPEKKRAALVEVTKVSPWTKAAWRAVGELEPALVKGK